MTSMLKKCAEAAGITEDQVKTVLRTMLHPSPLMEAHGWKARMGALRADPDSECSIYYRALLKQVINDDGRDPTEEALKLMVEENQRMGLYD